MNASTEQDKPISSAELGSMLEVARIDAEGEDAIRLKRMGICEGRRIQLIQCGDPMIIRVVGCRVGVSRRLASEVIVRSCTE